MYYTLYQRVTTTVSLCAVLLCSCQPELKIFQEDPPHARTLPSRTGHLSSHHPRASHPTSHPPACQATPPPELTPLVSSNHTLSESPAVVKLGSQEPADPSSSTANTSHALNNTGSTYARTFITSSGAKVRFSKANDQWQAIVQSAPNATTPQRILPIVSNQPVGPFMAWLQDQDPWTSRARVHVLSTAVTPYLPCVYLGKGGLAGGMPGSKRGAGALKDDHPDLDPLLGIVDADEEGEAVAMSLDEADIPDIPDDISALIASLADVNVNVSEASSRSNAQLRALAMPVVNACQNEDQTQREEAFQQLTKDAKSRNQQSRDASLEAYVMVATTVPDLLDRCLKSLLTVCQTSKQETVRVAALMAVARVAQAKPKQVVAFVKDAANNTMYPLAYRQIAICAHVAIVEVVPDYLVRRCVESLLDVCQDHTSRGARKSSSIALRKMARNKPNQSITLLEETAYETKNEAVSIAVSQALVEVAKKALNSAVKCCQSLMAIVKNFTGSRLAAKKANEALKEVAKVAPTSAVKEFLRTTSDADDQNMDSACYKRMRLASRFALSADLPQQPATTSTHPVPVLRNKMPLKKVPHYVTRINETTNLKYYLEYDRGGICVISGPGGSGKSTLAMHYALAHKNPQSIVRFVEASTQATLLAGFQQMAQELGINHKEIAQRCGADTHDYCQELCRAVYQQLASNGQPMLLILDNAQDAGLVGDCISSSDNNYTKIIITTRNQQAFIDYDTVTLAAFSPQEAQAYVSHRLSGMGRDRAPEAQAENIHALINTSGCMPLDLKLAMDYLQHYELETISTFASQCQHLKPNLRTDTIPAVVLGLSKAGPVSQQLMHYCTHLDVDFIPSSLLLALLKLSNLPELQQADATVQLQKVISPLQRLSLVKVVSHPDASTDERGIQIHQEIKNSCRDFQGLSSAVLPSDAAIREQLLDTLLRYADSAMPGRQPSHAISATLLRHGRVLYDTAGQEASLDHRAALAKCLAQACHRLSLFAEGRDWAERALILAREQHRDQTRPDVAEALREYGISLVELGQHREALPQKQSALKMLKELYERACALVISGAEQDAATQELLRKYRIDIARAQSDVSSSLSQLGKHQEALTCQKKVLGMRQELWPDQDHSEIAHTLNSIGELNGHLGHYQEAITHKVQSLEMRQRLFPNQNHPALARSLASVGIGYEQLGDLTQALRYKQAALVMRQALSKHQKDAGLAHSLNNMGDLLVKIGRIDQQNPATLAQGVLNGREGLDFCKQALAMRQQLYGLNRSHQYTADSLNSVGMALNALGDFSKGLSMAKQALDMLKDVYLRDDHSYKVRVLRTMSESLRALDRSDEASSCQNEALAMEARLKESISTQP
eukprot:CAMPEP_0116835826 /NCGR_PEP_ID=MMETSP0418-20121206/7755_1 /TAXON_ID=1158023 /ORGANISM="Astrosyne radiata, Strain 13vi08-1A" /LENGTH=1359 /DNA_ID=CAMNT_0004465525 /DNA_START=2975 /DNA_END=7054 /DNA_ORIENTATION=+